MGMSFDGNGKYVGWSNIFDYSSIQALKASEYLPMPNKTKFIRDTNTGTNIDSFISVINVANQVGNKAYRIRAYADLITFLNDNNITEVNWTIEPKEDILEVLRLHEFTVIPKNKLEMACKNFISSHIQNTVQNFTNMIGAYTPIEMKDFRGASEISPKGEQSKRMTLMNPATKYIMQYQNMTGKNVIGISATGIKAAFTWHYYMNEILQNNKNNSNKNLIERAKFEFKTSRINGRTAATIDSFTGTLKPDYKGDFTIESIPDICWDKVSNETKQLLFGDGSVDKNVLIQKLTVDLMQSQVLSAATDNAKELILSKVNCGSKLAKCYLFLITMGFDITDIVSFMTSPVVDFIDRVTESNIYRGKSLSIEDAIDILKRKIPNKIVHQFMNPRQAKIFSRTALSKKIKNAFSENKLDEIEVSSTDYEIIDYISELKAIRNLMPEMTESAKADLTEFQKVLEGSNEFSNFGRLLSINQGIGTTEEKFKSYLQFIKNIISERENKLGIKLDDKLDETLEQLMPNIEGILEEQLKNIHDQQLAIYKEIARKFNVIKWLDDPEYREKVKLYYGNILKVTVPIFDMIDEIPQYRDSFKILNAVNIINNNIALKTKINGLIMDNYIPKGGTEANSGANYWSERFKNNLLTAIYAKFIQQFLYKCNVQLPYFGTQIIHETIDGENRTRTISGTKLINEKFDLIEAPENNVLSLNSLQSLMSFKYIFENYIIPKLKEGKYITIDKEGKIVEKTDKMNQLKANKFIQGLISGEDKDRPVYRVNVDMLNYKTTPEGLAKFQSYIQGLQELQNIKINNVTLSDWFILYNLYTNLNNYGTNRLTTLFESFIRTNGKSSIIKDFFKYISDLSYYGTAEYSKNNTIIIKDKDGNTFNIDVKDLFMMAATIIQSPFGKGDPMYIVAQDSGSVFYERTDDGQYAPVPNLYFSDNSQESTLNRQTIINDYLTVGGLAQEQKIQILNQLNKINYNTIDAINLLIKDSFITLYKNNCR